MSVLSALVLHPAEMIMLVASVIIALMCLVNLLLQHELTLKLREEGLHAHGEVVQVDDHCDSDGDSFEVKYVLHLQDGSELRGSYTVEKAPPVVGDTVEALYLSHNPRRYQLVGREVGLTRVVVNLAGLGVFMSIAVYLLMSNLHQEAPKPHRSPTPSWLRSYNETENPTPRGTSPVHRTGED